MDEWERSREKVKLKGLRTPHFIVWLIGHRHGRKGFIRIENGVLKSVYVDKKEKSYQVYSAGIWKGTAEELYSIRKRIIKLIAELESIDNLIKQNEGIIVEQTNLSVQQLRKQKREARIQENLKKEKTEKINQLPELAENINLEELRTEEILLEARRKLEKIIAIYLQGAQKYILDEVKFEIQSDPYSYEIYKTRNKRLNEIQQDIMNFLKKEEEKEDVQIEEEKTLVDSE